MDLGSAFISLTACRCRNVFFALWLTTLLSTSSYAVFADDSNKAYQLGRGYPLGDTGFALGGYAGSHLEALGKWPASLSLSSLSLFVTWDNGAKLRFFQKLKAKISLM